MPAGKFIPNCQINIYSLRRDINGYLLRVIIP